MFYFSDVVITKIAREGNNVTLSCRLKKNESGYIIWYGPPDYKTLYANGTVINPRIKSIAIVGDHSNGQYNLLLNFVTSFDEGRYKCSMSYNGTIQSQKFSLHIQKRR